MRLLPFKQVPTIGTNLFHKLAFVFLLAIIPILIVSTMINRSGESATYKEITGSLKSNAHFYLSSFELEMERVLRLKKETILDNEIQNLMLFHMISSDSDILASVQDIERRLQRFKDSSLFVDEVKLYMPELGLAISNDRVERTPIPDEERDALTQMQQSGEIFFPLGSRLIVGEKYPNTILYGIPARLLLEVELSRTNMENTLRDIAQYNGGEALLIDRNGAWSLGSIPDGADAEPQQLVKSLVLSNEGKSSDPIGSFKIGKEEYIYAYETSDVLNATIVVYVPEKSLLGPIRWYKQLYWILAGTSVLVILFFSIWIYKQVHQPMYKLTGAFRRLEKGEFETYLTYGRKDEFHYLYTQFNKMSGRLQQLIKDVYEQELRFNRAELKQLQAQINPHFLYNIFFLLNRIIQFEDMENAKKLTKYLGQYFRFITRNKEDEVELQSEMEHINSYIGIQQLRFGKKLSVLLAPLPEITKPIKVPRLILQPIVENAFEYGLEDHMETGKLEIKVELDQNAVVIHVEDNGSALSESLLEQLGQLLSGDNKQMETTGMLNVHRRLQLKFGKPYGLTVGRSNLGGMHIRIRIPLDELGTGGYPHV